MRPLLTRIHIILAYLIEAFRQGFPHHVGPFDQEIAFILDGVGGFQFVPLLVRRVLRERRANIGTILFRWQFGLPGEIFTDLGWLSRNHRQAQRLADAIADVHQRHPAARIHIIAFSAGCGIAVFACEKLAGRAEIDTLLLACPALSPQYNLAPALAAVKRCYALVSLKDTFLLGIGTRIFGTVDRKRCPAAGQVGFRIPPDLAPQERLQYDKLREVVWTPDLCNLGHYGGHTGWACLPFLREHLLDFLAGRPRLPLRSAACD